MARRERRSAQRPHWTTPWAVRARRLDRVRDLAVDQVDEGAEVSDRPDRVAAA